MVYLSLFVSSLISFISILKFSVVVQLLICVWLFVTPWTAACYTFLFFTMSHSLFKPLFVESSQWCHPAILSSAASSFCLQSFLSIVVFSNESALCISSVAQSCLTLCSPMNHSTPGLPVHHQLLECIQTHVRWVGDAIQPSHLPSFPSPLACNLSQHQGLFKWVHSSNQVANILELQL